MGLIVIFDFCCINWENYSFSKQSILWYFPT